MFRKFRDLIFYAGLPREDYLLIKEKMNLSNRLNIVAFSLIASFTFSGLIIYGTIVQGDVLYNIPGYLGTLIFSLVMAVLNLTLSKKFPLLIHISVYIFMYVLLGFGIWLGTIQNPLERTAAFIAILVMLPTLFYVPPIGIIITTIISVSAYIYLAIQTQFGEVLRANVVNVTCFGVLSIATSSYIMTIRAKSYNSARISEYLSITDQLTGIGNRRKYESVLDELRKYSKNFTIVALDVNNLKKINDTLGHKAGDELITGAADCIKNSFGKYGQCFRTGGDEFIAIIKNYKGNPENIGKEFEELTHKWKGNLVDTLSVSYGMISTADNKDLSTDELIIAADKLMYKSKARYYKS